MVVKQVLHKQALKKQTDLVHLGIIEREFLRRQPNVAIVVAQNAHPQLGDVSACHLGVFEPVGQEVRMGKFVPIVGVVLLATSDS